MGLNDVAQLVILIVALAVAIPIFGGYMARVYGGGSAPFDRVFAPLENAIYRICGIDPKGEQRWRTYALSLLAFSAVSVLVLYAIQRVQQHLPLDPNHAGAVPAPLAFNTAVQLPDQYQLAELLGRDRDVDPHPDDRPDRAELHLGGRRRRRRGRPDARADPAPLEHARQLLGRSGAHGDAAPVADLASSRR